ncbi:MAG: hypothetical protein L6247_00770 [Desulfobacteraceae bacterium]|nr:hypothetical protein [Desulfobacteraceae bacterium]
MNSDFVLEEYKQKRAYLRHIESFDLKIIQWYFAIVGAGLAFLWKGANSISEPLKISAAPLLIFLVVYSVFISLFLFFRKRNYKAFVDRILELENKHCGTSHEIRDTQFFSVFRFRHSFVNLAGAACSFLLIMALFKNNCIYFSAIVGALYLVIFTIFPWLLSKSKKPTSSNPEADA